MIKNLRIKKKNIVPTMVCCFIVYLSGSALTSIKTGIQFRHQVSLLFYLILFIVLIFSFQNKKAIKQLALLSIVTFGIYVLGMINYTATAIELIKQLVLFLLLFLFCCYSEKIQFNIWNCIDRIIFYISAISLVFFILINVLHLSLPHSSIQVGNLTFDNYFQVFFTCSLYHIDKFGLTFYRLQGIFWEPGVLGVFLNFSLLYKLFIKKQYSKLELFISLTCLLLTISTTGICLGIALFSLRKFLDIKSTANKIILAIPFIIITVSLISKVWLDKMLETNGIINSYYTRLSDLTLSLELWKNNFILGTGFHNEDLFVLGQGLGRKSSNGLLTWCYTMGLVGIVSVMIPFIVSIIKCKMEEKIASILLCVTFIINNMTEPLMDTPIMLLIISYMCYLSFQGGRYKDVVSR